MGKKRYDMPPDKAKIPIPLRYDPQPRKPRVVSFKDHLINDPEDYYSFRESYPFHKFTTLVERIVNQQTQELQATLLHTYSLYKYESPQQAFNFLSTRIKSDNNGTKET